MDSRRRKKFFVLAVSMIVLLMAGAQAWGDVAVNETNFPDDNFRSYVSTNCDTNSGGVLSDAEISAVAEFQVHDMNIASLKGVEYFTDLISLDCDNNHLTSLDITQNTNLEYLSCVNTQLTALDVTQNTALTSLYCDANLLTALDVSKNNALTVLRCENNQLTALDVSKNTALTELDCSNNKLISLDVTHNSSLNSLICSKNQLTVLDVTQNTDLWLLTCYNNHLASLDLNTALQNLECYSNQLIVLDVAKITELYHLDCRYNSLPALDLSQNSNPSSISTITQRLTIPTASIDETGDSAYPYSLNINTLNLQLGTSIDIQRIASLDVNDDIDGLGSTITHSTDVSASMIYFASFPVHIAYNYDVMYQGQAGTAYMDVAITVSDSTSDNTNIAVDSTNFPDSIFREYVSTNLDTDNDGYLSSSDIAAVTSLDVSGMSISSLKGIEYFTAITSLDCSNNSLTSLDVASLDVLETLICYGNQLTALDVTQNLSLQILNCGEVLTGNQITTLDVTQNSALTELLCESNLLTSLDVTHNPNLLVLQCGWNSITSLDMSANTNLILLHCTDNQLTALNVTNNSQLMYLFFEENPVSEIDVTQNSMLELLECSNTSVTSLNVANNPNLKHLACAGNSMTSLNVTNNTLLENLVCYDNNLTELNVSNNPKLLGLLCGGNALETLDVSNNTGLVILNCEGNNLSSLDLQVNTSLDSADLFNAHFETPSMYDYVYDDSRFQASNFTGQTLSTMVGETSSNASYAYQLDMSSLSLGEKALQFSVKDSEDNTVTSTYDSASGILYFASMPQTVTYWYDTQYSGYLASANASMDATFSTSVFTITPSVSSISFDSPTASAQTVTITASNYSGTVNYAATVSPSTGLVLTVSGNTLTIQPIYSYGYGYERRKNCNGYGQCYCSGQYGRR